jgi:hypothetical protein
MNHFPRTFALCTLAYVTGCGTAGMTTYTPVHQKTKYSADSLHIAARDAIDQLGYQPAGGDAGAHVIETREKQVATSSIPRLSYKYTFKIETTNGVLEINATCVQNSATSEATFKDCGDDRPQRVVNEQKKLVKRILEIAPNAESKNVNWEGYGQPEPEEDKSEKADKDDKGKKGDKSDKEEKADKKDEKADKKDEKADKKADKKDEKADKKADKKEEKADKKDEKSDKKKSAKSE